MPPFRSLRFWLFLPFVAAFLLPPLPLAQKAPPVPSPPSPSVYFSPHGGCTQAIVAELDSAWKSIRVQAYGFTSPEITAALARAYWRGVRVEVILDKSNRAQRSGALLSLLGAGVPVWIDACHAIAHNKVILIDDKTVITGSFNFTEAAENRNAENLLVLHDAALAAAISPTGRSTGGIPRESGGLSGTGKNKVRF